MTTVYGEAEIRGEDTWIRPLTGYPIQDIPLGTTLVVEGVQFSGISVVVIDPWGVSVASDPDPQPPGNWRFNQRGDFKTRIVPDRSRFARL